MTIGSIRSLPRTTRRRSDAQQRQTVRCPFVARRYDSSLRRERAELTRDRIIDAGTALVHEFSSWDWRELSVRAVAERAGVHERTVYRHFPTEEVLRAAVVERLQQEAGLRPEDVTIDNIADQVARLFTYLASFSSSAERRTDAALAAVDERRKAALLDVVIAAAPGWSEQDQRATAALVDVLWGVPNYRRLVDGWQLDEKEATRAVTRLLRLLLADVSADPAQSSTRTRRR
jgi:AcrR family transcriptional regulator